MTFSFKLKWELIRTCGYAIRESDDDDGYHDTVSLHKRRSVQLAPRCYTMLLFVSISSHQSTLLPIHPVISPLNSFRYSPFAPHGLVVLVTFTITVNYKRLGGRLHYIKSKTPEKLPSCLQLDTQRKQQ